MYPTHNYEGAPEFDIANREMYKVENDEDLPSLIFHTPMDPEELSVLPPEHSYVYQTDVHFELERWTIFRSLPMLLNYDEQFVACFMGLNKGTIKVPDYYKEINPKSLWQYYYTLPKWCRDNPCVRNVLMGMEYHQPLISSANKELALNYVCSLIRPLDPVIVDVISELASSNKIRLNIALGKQMMAELKFYELDPLTVGSETDVEEEEYGLILDGIESGSVATGVDELDDERRE